MFPLELSGSRRFGSIEHISDDRTSNFLNLELAEVRQEAIPDVIVGLVRSCDLDYVRVHNSNHIQQANRGHSDLEKTWRRISRPVVAVMWWDLRGFQEVWVGSQQ